MTIPTVLKNLVVEIPNFMDVDFCQHTIQHAQDMGLIAATITTEQGTTVTPDIRNNDRVIFDDADLAQDLWKKAKPHFQAPFKTQTAVGLNERFRIYRYRPGQFFDWHQDGTFRKSDNEISQFTMLIYLNDGFTGGDTSFADIFSPHIFQDFVVEPSIGKAVFFHHPLSHRGDPVLTGEKFVLRTDIMFAPAS